MGIRVLLADDDTMMRRLIGKILEDLGVDDVVEVANGDQALTKYFDESFGLVVLDWHMPGVDGLDVVKLIRAGGSETPILMVTGESQESLVLEAIQAGITDYVKKPFDHTVLREKLAPYCRGDQQVSVPVVYRAAALMNTDIITVDVNTTIGDAIEILLEHSISGVPVVHDGNQLIGMITEFELIQAIYRPEIKETAVGKSMETGVVAVAEDTILSDVAKVMEQRRIRRVPVTRNGELVGIISRRDLLRYVTNNENALREFLSTINGDGP